MPASTAVITDATTVATNGPNAATTAKSIAAAGPIIDYPGMVQNVILDFSNLKDRVAALILATDSTDSANLTLLQNIQITLS
jgi:hypothetical protein